MQLNNVLALALVGLCAANPVTSDGLLKRVDRPYEYCCEINAAPGDNGDSYRCVPKKDDTDCGTEKPRQIACNKSYAAWDEICDPSFHIACAYLVEDSTGERNLDREMDCENGNEKDA